MKWNICNLQLTQIKNVYFFVLMFLTSQLTSDGVFLQEKTPLQIYVYCRNVHLKRHLLKTILNGWHVILSYLK